MGTSIFMIISVLRVGVMLSDIFICSANGLKYHREKTRCDDSDIGLPDIPTSFQDIEVDSNGNFRHIEYPFHTYTKN